MSYKKEICNPEIVFAKFLLEMINEITECILNTAF